MVTRTTSSSLPLCGGFAVVALLMMLPPQVEGRACFGDCPEPPPVPSGYDLVEQMHGLQGPTRIALSSEGNVFVTDHTLGVVAVFNGAGERIATMVEPVAPLGLALWEGSGGAPVEPPPLPAYCPTEQTAYTALIQGHQDRVTQFDGLVTKYEALAEAYRAKLAQPGLSPRLKRQYLLKVRRFERKVVQFAGRLNTFQELVQQYLVCDTWSNTNERIPLPVVYIGDEADGSVLVITGKQVSRLGGGAGEFGKPNGIAVTVDGQRVYVTDSTAHQVKMYDGAGVFVTAFGGQGAGDGQLDFPVDVVVNEGVGEVYVTDFFNQRVAVFDLAGTWLRNINAPLNDNGDPAFYRPMGLGIGPNGDLYVVDSALSCMVKMDNTGTLLGIIGYGGGKYWNGELLMPLDVAADGERIYVTSDKHNAVRVYAEITP